MCSTHENKTLNKKNKYLMLSLTALVNAKAITAAFEMSMA